MAYSYRKLIGKIVEHFKTRELFAKSIGMSPVTLSNKLNNKSDWSQDEMMKAMVVLEIPITDVGKYFFDH